MKYLILCSLFLSVLSTSFAQDLNWAPRLDSSGLTWYTLNNAPLDYTAYTKGMGAYTEIEILNTYGFDSSSETFAFMSGSYYFGEVFSITLLNPTLEGEYDILGSEITVSYFIFMASTPLYNFYTLQVDSSVYIIRCHPLSCEDIVNYLIST